MEEQVNDIPVRYFAVQFADKFIEGQFYGREYFYRTKKQDLKEGDIINIPTRYGTSKVLVTRVDLTEEELKESSFPKDKLTWY